MKVLSVSTPILLTASSFENAKSLKTIASLLHRYLS